MKKTTVFVNLEPCVMCSGMLYQLGVQKMIFGACNPRFGGVLSIASNQLYGHPNDIEVLFK